MAQPPVYHAPNNPNATGYGSPQTVYGSPQSSPQFVVQPQWQQPQAAGPPPPQQWPQHAPPPPSAPSAPADPTATRMAKLAELAMRYEIRGDFIARLRALESFEIVLILDDSGSMNSVCQSGAATSANPYARQGTRWDELRTYVNVVVDVASCLDANGIDVYFLNRPPMFGVTSSQQVQAAFGPQPAGFTPLARVTSGVLSTLAPVLNERKVLLIVATDGQPTDDAGNARIQQYVDVIGSRHRGVYLTLLACTDDEDSVRWMNAVDHHIPNVDVCDDYHSERKEVLRAQGPSFHFTYGDYVIKTLLGSVDPYFDGLDTPPGTGRGASGGDCCTVA